MTCEECGVAREALGTKRICPETGKKFYDLGKEPIVSPYTGKSYPLSYFEEKVPEKVTRKEPASEPAAKKEPAKVEEEEIDEDDASGPEFISLEDADEDSDDSDSEDEEIPDIPDVDVDEDENEEEEDDVFLEEEEGDDDLSDVIGGVDGEEET